MSVAREPTTQDIGGEPRVNNELLKVAIKERGVAHQFLAEKIGITPQAFSQKIRGKSDFRLKEASVISDVLKLEPAEIMAIFFG